MPDVFLTRRQLMLAKTETTYGVDAAPSHANSYEAIKLVDPFTLDIGTEMLEQSGGNLTRGSTRPIAGLRPFGVTFRTYVCGIEANTYAATVKPPIGDLLQACGYFGTFISSNAVGRPAWRYAPAADARSDTSVTLVPHQDGYEHRAVGGRGNVNFIMAKASPWIAEFNFRAILATEAATVRAAPTGLPTQIPPRWIDSGSIIVQSYALPVENMNLGTNNTVFESPASIARSSSGIIQCIITERAPGGSFDPEATHPSTLDFFGMWRSSSGAVLKLNAGLAQGNQCSIVASQMMYKQVGWGDKSGLAIFSTDYQLYEKVGNDEMIIEFS